MIDGEVVLVDYSKWNGLSNNSVLRTLVAGGILKVTDNVYNDPLFEANFQDRAGDPMGGYHYVRVNGDAKEQADAFVDRLREVAGQGYLLLGRWLDCEDKGSPGTTPQQRADTIACTWSVNKGLVRRWAFIQTITFGLITCLVCPG